MKSLIAAVLLAAPCALAHFRLVAPASWAAQDNAGNPQKSAPCGQADPMNPIAPTGAPPIEFQQGSMVSIRIKETVFHPGHYRVSIAANQAGLPADPPVTSGTTACGATVINTSPSMPLLADGLLLHTTTFGGVEQTMQVQLPAGLTCTNCVLQITEFMSNHVLNNPGGCFYHHCANVSIVAPDAGAGDAGTIDAGAIDAGAIDAGTLDAGEVDAGLVDGGGSGGGVGGGGGGAGGGATSGSGGGSVDGGVGGVDTTPGCGCSGSGFSAAAALAGLGAMLRRRRHS